MARPRKNPPSKMLSIRFPLTLLDRLRHRGNVNAQIVEAVEIYLSAVGQTGMPAKSTLAPQGTPTRHLAANHRTNLNSLA